MTVHLIGAGPGDPDLLTVRAAELLRTADVVVSDRPSSDPVVALAPDGAERVLVGKVSAHDEEPARRALPQDEVCRLLVKLGRSGREVVRLKSGDPFVAARGGEEALALQDAGVPFTVVPGISAGIAAPAFAGIPVHVRQLSRVVTVLAGNADPEYPGEIDWDALARLDGTIVVLTGRSRIRRIAGALLAAGMADDTPVAAISAAGRAGAQTTIRGTLAALPPRLPAPVTFVIGAVAALDLDWFDGGTSAVASPDEAVTPLAPGGRGATGDGPVTSPGEHDTADDRRVTSSGGRVMSSGGRDTPGERDTAGDVRVPSSGVRDTAGGRDTAGDVRAPSSGARDTAGDGSADRLPGHEDRDADHDDHDDEEAPRAHP